MLRIEPQSGDTPHARVHGGFRHFTRVRIALSRIALGRLGIERGEKGNMVVAGILLTAATDGRGDGSQAATHGGRSAARSHMGDR